MPKVRWNISAAVIDEFDRSRQYAPYTGPMPPNGVYKFKIQRLVAVAATKESKQQLRVGLELVPRKGRHDEVYYAGYFIMAFLTISPEAAFTYVPFCDAIGVRGTDFCERMVSDREGNIHKIGKWRNDGTMLILAQIEDDTYKGVTRKKVKWMGAFDQNIHEGSAADAFDDDDDEYGDEEIDDDELDDVAAYNDDDDEPF